MLAPVGTCKYPGPGTRGPPTLKIWAVATIIKSGLAILNWCNAEVIAQYSLGTQLMQSINNAATTELRATTPAASSFK